MNQTYRYLLVPCVLGLIGSSAACELIASVDRSEVTGAGGSTTSSTDATTTGATTGTGGAPSTSTSTGTGGTGGATTTSTGSTGATSSSSASSASSGSSSSTGGMACASASDCPMPANACVTRLCTAGVCSQMNVAADTPIPAQTAGDCKQIVCDGTGDTLTVDDDNDIPSDNEACTVDTCASQMASHTPAAAGTDCTAQGPAPKHLCGDPNGANAGKCVQCNVTADCAAGKTCVAGACQ